MIILLKNNTTNDISLNDLSGITITSNGSLNILQYVSITDLAQSDALLINISSNNIIVNDGTEDLSIGDAIRYISLYKHVNPVSKDGKEIIKSQSGPPGTQISFTGIGDNIGIHDGTSLTWDASVDLFITNDSTSLLKVREIPDGFKRKIIQMRYNDPTYVKEGTLFYWNMMKGSYVDMSIVCPSGQYYLDRSGVPHKANSNIYISTYVSGMHLYDSCPCGLHLLSEASQEDATPINYETWIEITVPIEDTSSYGFGLFTLYRLRTSLLPGESV